MLEQAELEPIGDRVRRLRLARGLTRHDFAALAGVSVDRLLAIEFGAEPRPGGRVLGRIARALSVSAAVLGVQDPRPEQLGTGVIS